MTKTKKVTRNLTLEFDGHIKPYTFDVLISCDILEEAITDIARQMKGKLIYDGKGNTVENVVGKIINTKVMDDFSIQYHAEMINKKEKKKIRKGYNSKYSIKSNFINPPNG